MAASSVEYTIGGVKIHFPCKAYPSQLAMMNSIVRGLNYGQHCLLESPTGSGKSLALLCSTLGWQRAQFGKLQGGGNSVGDKTQSDKSSGDLKKSDANAPCQCVCHRATPASLQPEVVDLTVSPCKEAAQAPPPATEHVSPPEEPQPKSQSSLSAVCEEFNSSVLDDSENDDDFQRDRKRIRTAEPKGRKRQRLEKGVIFIDDEPPFESPPSANQSWNTQPHSPAASLPPSCCSGEPCARCPCAFDKDCAKEKEKDDKKKIPKIFFGTRTHKQITQIARELKRSVYSGVPMTILSSRNHTCVNPEVAPHANRNERCKDLLDAKDGRSCRYYHGIQRIREKDGLHRVLGLHEAWDVEDLASLGKRLRLCSYFAARELMDTSNIIFCPYNYLLDPMIRDSMEIDLTGQILVLDEAHNIEDCARESASYTLTQQSLLLCRDELEGMIRNRIRTSGHEALRGLCYSLINWIQESQSLMSDRGYESASKVWTGKDVLVIFRGLGVTADTFRILKQHLAAVLEKEERVGFVNGREDLVQLPTISTASSTVLKNLFMVLDFLYRDSSRFADDYRVALQKTYAWTTQLPPDVPDANGFLVRPRHRQRQNHRVKTEVLTLSFWCLNPAVAFSDLSGTVHSIVLTSGTLSPMGSFSSELGVKFTIQLEANHVINKSQVWVGTVGAGPQGRKLCATFQHTETYAFQDEVGALLLHICQVMSKGVLCFLPSYKMLDKLRDRWINTGLWKKLEQHKTVIAEPRGGGKGDFDELLGMYYDAIKYCEDRDGALLMAVCRGKVSEGLDFTDDNARAVVTIGIPFPNIKDLQVELKMKYNDQHCKTRGLLPGGRWYEIQAYRALNQALGRCIRHRNDWGALILVDDRYRNNPHKYITGLSKWVRQLVRHHDSFSDAMQSLGAFSELQQRVGSPAAAGPPLGSAVPVPTRHTPAGAERRKAPEAQTAASAPCPVGPQQHTWPPTSVSDKQSKAETGGNAGCLKMMHSPSVESIYNPKPTAQPLYPMFTSSPISTCFRKPIFKEKGWSDSRVRVGSACLAQSFMKDTQPQKDQAMEEPPAGPGVTETEPEAPSVGPDPPTRRSPPTCESDPPCSDDADDAGEDQTVFFTPELFEADDGEEGSPQNESEAQTPPTSVPEPLSPALPSEGLPDSEAQGQGPAPPNDGQRAFVVSRDDPELSQGEAEETVRPEQMENQNRQTGSRLRRLSRSRHKAAGNQ